MKPFYKVYSFALIGENIAYSLSPIIHGLTARELGVNITYKTISLSAAELGGFFKSARELYNGFNVTKPHKSAAVQYLDKTSPPRADAVNTVVNKDGRLTGYNTDGFGFTQSLKVNRLDVAGKEVLLLGAGGAAAAVAKELVKLKARLIIYNRTFEKAERLARAVGARACGFGADGTDGISGTGAAAGNTGAAGTAGTPKAAGTGTARASLSPQIIVNATSFGLKTGENPLPAFCRLDDLEAVYDAIYSPPVTDLIRFCLSAKPEITAVNGLDMLIFQAIAAQALFIGRRLTDGEIYDIFMSVKGGLINEGIAASPYGKKL